MNIRPDIAIHLQRSRISKMTPAYVFDVDECTSTEIVRLIAEDLKKVYHLDKGSAPISSIAFARKKSYFGQNMERWQRDLPWM